MAEHKNSSNNGHLPFRRYVPPTDKLTNHLKNSNNGQVMPFPQTPPASQTSSPAANEMSYQRARADRSRWRRWINGGTTAKVTASESPRRHPSLSYSQPTPQRPQPPQPPSPNLGKPSTASLPAMNRPLSSPRQGIPTGHQDSPATSPSAYVKRPQGQSPQRSSFHAVNPAATHPSGAADPRLKPPVTPGSGNKVTPLRRRKPVWSTPAEVTPPPEPSQRDRRSARSRGRKAPRPILLGIRLLILGTGLAAIAGTILSTANSNREASVADPVLNSAAADAPGWGRRSQIAAALSQPLPLAEELVHLETDLVELGALTPGLAQSVFLYDLDTGNYVDLDGAKALSAASTIKMPILVAFLEAVDAGTLRLDQAVMLREELVGGGSGDMQTHEPGSRYTALEVATEMIVNSDNTATNMVIDLLDERELINQRLREWGLETTVLRKSLTV